MKWAAGAIELSCRATATRKSALLGSGEDGAKAAGRLGEPRVDIVGRLLVIGVDRIISQNRDIDPEWVVVDHTVPECRTETRPGRGARRIMFFFEIRLEELPAQLER